jgi:WD40 repeat protein/type II secretory pathway predicted ATPase ExeA
MQDLSGTSIKGYQLQARLGEGAYGAVYRASQPQVRREVAIKVILPEYANRPDFIRRFESEAQIVAQLEHLHIVPLYDYWREPGGAYLVMRLMKGGSLEQSLRENGPWQPAEAARLVDQIASALDAAHKQGVVHRDLKPANILLDEERNAYLSDFGIAKEMGVETGVTQTGAILGTPAYITPEQVQSQPVTPQTDIYSLGVVLYELLVGGHPFPDTPTGELVVKHLSQPLPLVRDQRPDVPAEVDEVIQKATSKDPTKRYPGALTMAAAFRRALRLEVGLPAVPEGEITNPYKGLRAFQEADANDFFGREALTGQLLARLIQTPSPALPLPGGGRRFLAVVGPSGSGKSSVVKAGLLPALRKGALPGSEQWFITEMVPGVHPLEELELALFRIASRPDVNIAEQLERDERGLLRAARLVLPQGGELVLVVDQLEEVFTLVPDPKTAAFFLQSLYEAVVDPKTPLRVVVTLRADFYDRPLMHPDFSRLMQARTEVVVPLSPEELEHAIRAPAEQVGALFEQGLIATIITKLVNQPGYLPLLQYALTELFEHRNGRMLTNEAYQSIGGVLGALGRQAEEVYDGLDQAGKAAARQLFLRLVTLGEGVEDTRRRVLRTELEGLIRDRDEGEGDRDQYSVISIVIDTFGGARLLTFDRDPITRKATVEVAHEALIREWPVLREWLNQDRDGLRLHRHLTVAALSWEKLNRDSGDLYRGARLAQALEWFEQPENVEALNKLEQDFLAASHEFAEQEAAAREAQRKRELETAQARAEEQARAAGQLRRRALYLVAALLVALVLVIVAVFFGWQERRQTAIATARELALAAQSNLTVDPELAILLGLQSASAWASVGEPVPYDLQDTLHRAIPASRARLTWPAGDEAILSVSFIQPGDQPRVVTGDRQVGTVTIWDPLSNQSLATVPGSVRSGSSGGISPIIRLSLDGQQLAVPAEDNTVKLWDVSSGKERCTFSHPSEEVLDAYFSPDDEYLFTIGSMGYIVWETGTCQQQLEINTSSNFSKAAAFSPDGKTIAAVTEEGLVSIWDIVSGRQVSTIQAGFNLTALAFSPDGARLTGAGRENFALEWDVATGQTVVTLSLNQAAGGQVGAMAYSPDGNSLVIMGSFYDAASGENLYSLLGHTKPLSSLAFDMSGSRLITSSSDGTVKLWDLSPEHEVMTLSHPSGWLYGVAFSPNGKWLVTSGQDQTAVVWDILSAEKLWTLQGHTDTVNSVAFSPDGNLLATGGADRVVMIWDTHFWQVLHTLAGHGEDRTSVPPIRGTYAVDFSPLCNDTVNGPCHLVGVGHDGQLIVWDALSGQHQLGYQDSDGGLMSVAFSPDGTHLAVGNASVGGDGWATILEATSGQLLHSLPGASGWVWGLDYSPDGRDLATINFDGDGTVWDLEGGQAKAALTGVLNGGYSLAFSTDGKLLAAGSNGSVEILDASTGLPLLSLPGHQSLVVRLAFSPDGRTLATASLDGTARVYVVPPEDLLALARSRLTRPLNLEECQKYLHQEMCP